MPIVALPSCLALVADHEAVFDADHAGGSAGCFGVVGDDDDGDALGDEFVQQRHEFCGSVTVEGAGWFVGKNDFGTVGERSGDRDALLLPAGKLVGTMVHAVAQTDEAEHRFGSFLTLLFGNAGIDEREHDVVERAHLSEQIELLEDESDMALRTEASSSSSQL